jgi:sterol desaturase/sphingolipid hydroxylase (fatty acid hydroxylase superfamily)
VFSRGNWFLEELARQTEGYWALQVSFLGFFWLCLFEALFTRRSPLRTAGRQLITDMCYWLFMPPLRIVSRFLSVILVALIGLLLGIKLGPHLLDGYGPLSRQPPVLLMVELVLLMDLTTYWMHRWFHTVPLLWRFHSLHHSATYIRWSTTGRNHPVNEIANYLATVVPFALVGFPVSAVLPATPLIIFYALFAHTQWNISFGPLSGVFVSPRFHRWHHTHSDEGGNKNFANIFALWDRLFGTYYLPEGRLPEKFGLDIDDVPQGYLAQLAYPWRRPTVLSSAATHPSLAHDASAQPNHERMGSP